MKKIASVLFVLILCVVGFGFYRGWFALSSPSPGMESNKVNINLVVDPDRMKEDTKMVKEQTLAPTTEVNVDPK